MRKFLLFSYVVAMSVWVTSCHETAIEEVAEADGASGATRKSMSNAKATGNTDWWPNQLNLVILRQNSAMSNPMAADFNYIEEFNSLDYDSLKSDIRKVLTESKDW